MRSYFVANPKLKAARLSAAQIDALQDMRDRLPNLQLLEGPENISKSATDPKSWVAATYPGDGGKGHLERHALPWVPADVSEFDAFYAARRTELGRRIRASLGTGASDGK